MEQDDNVHLKWNMHQDTFTSVFTTLLESEKFVDCIVSAEGQCLNVHKIVLSACSPYFEFLFSHDCEKYPIIVLPDVKFQVLKSLIYFMYCGEMSVPKYELDTLLRTAEFLQIKGLSPAVNVNTGSSLESGRKNGIHHHIPPLAERQRVCVEKITEGDPPHLPLQRKRDTGVPAGHTHRKSDQHFLSGCRTQSGSLTMKEENTCSLTSSNESTVIKVVKTKLHDHISKSCSNPCSPSSGCNYTHTVGEVVGNDPEVLVTEFSTPLCAVFKEEAIDEGGFGTGVLPIVPQESEFESFEDDMEVIAVDGCVVPEVDNISSKQSFLDSKSPSRAQQFAQREGSSACVPEAAHSQSSLCKCPVCGRSYQHYKSLIRHRKYECGKEPQFKCTHCQSCFTQKCSLKYHMIKRHQMH